MLTMIYAFCITIMLALIGNCAATELSGTVVSVSDGDTIAVFDSFKGQHKIRLPLTPDGYLPFAAALPDCYHAGCSSVTRHRERER
jgi:hypothetical protein